MIPAGRLEIQPWKSHIALGRFIRALAAKGITARLVGGAVREALLERFNNNCDLDIAIDVTPDEMIATCLESGVQVIPSGVQYGTVTCIFGAETYEFTSLRKDISTDGRRALVTYTRDWHKDAHRRDLTINALYADWDGLYYDPTEMGVEDLHSQTLRFIGDASQRIQEDYLRIVRFFRFMGLFSDPKYDQGTYDTCIRFAKQLKSISLERKWSELKKIFKSHYPLNIIESLLASKVMSEICRINWSLNKIERSITWNQNYFEDIFYGILGGVNHFILDRNTCIPMTLQKRLQEAFDVNFMMPLNLKDLYWAGRAAYKDAYIKHTIVTHHFSNEELQKCNENLIKIETWDIPKFPVSGDDLQELGFTPGPIIGSILNQTEKWWVDHDFIPNAKACLHHIQQLQLIKLRDKI